MDKIEKSRKERILDFVNENNYQRITVKQLAVIFGVPKEDVKFLEKIVSELEKEGKIYIDDSNRICKLNKGSQYIGRFEAKAYSFGFVRIDNELEAQDVFVAREEAMGALSDDLVLVNITKQKTVTKNAEGKIVKIIKRGERPVVGIFKKSESFGFVEPVQKGVQDIYIPKKFSLGVMDNARVVVKIEKYATETRKAEGKIIEVLGSENTADIERTMLIKAALVNEKFLDKVLKEADRVQEPEINFTQEELDKRADLRDKNIYTIDSEEAKDLDDAVSIEKLEDGTYKLSVHIADVSHYVTENSEINKEAIKRGTSIYLPGYVIPMLPRSLSNGACSLNEGEDKLTLSIDMIIDKSAKILYSYIYKSIICSKKKMTYEKVEKVLKNEDKKVLKEYKNFIPDILLMQELSKILRENRKKNGSIDFDIPETKVILDDNGEVLEIKPYEVGESNQIIEEFMLVANKTIAKTFYDIDAPFIYRIHEKPEIEVLRELNEVLSVMGTSIKGINKIHPRAISDVLEKFKNDESKKTVLSKLVLRSLKIAKYSNECLGHFGLNFNFYTHFTSPIRRYPDLFIHRVISKYIENGYVLEDKEIQKLYKQAKEYAFSSSACEKVAATLERDAIDLYMAKYMKKHLGDEFEGVISGVNNYGFYVKLPSTVEGLVTMSSLEDDYYIYEEKNMRLIGQRTKKTYCVGDKVKVKVIRADDTNRQIDFLLIGGFNEKE
ncbi:MAG: ribonuclease R [Clostridia bacterium]|nr:ribonuclease R [Clostridia bacterium]